MVLYCDRSRNGPNSFFADVNSLKPATDFGWPRDSVFPVMVSTMFDSAAGRIYEVFPPGSRYVHDIWHTEWE